MRLLKNIQRLTLSTIFILALSACSSKDNSDANTTAQGGATQDTGTASGTGAGNEANLTRNVNVILPPDVTPPVITLNGESTVTVFQDTPYTELSAIATDVRDANVSVSVSGSVDVSTLGSYIITYTAVDSAGNSATAQRTVNVVLSPDTQAPVITLNGDGNITLTVGESYEELGATAHDQRDGDVNVTISGSVDTAIVGTYTINYTATDKVGNVVTANRTVTVVAPALASLSLESNVTTLNVGETAELIVLATYSDNSTKEVTNEVKWIITPIDAIKVKNTTLTTLKDKATTLKATLANKTSEAISLNITWVVNGHTLPPEPDPVENDATLGGVDNNSNGVRDDVERNIYATYPVKLQRELVMYRAIVFQEAMIRPVNEARETTKIGRKSSNCRLYLRRKDAEIKSDEFRPVRFLENKTVNTKERIRKYLDYNIALSGGSYGSSPRDWNRESCSPEIIKALEEMGK